MMGPALDMWRRQVCFACRGDSRPVFTVDAALLRDCGQIFRLCRYCADRLSARRGFAPDHWPWLSFMAFGEDTAGARRADIANRFGPGRATAGDESDES